MHKLSILVFLLLLNAGCAVYPTSRTYYEPNSADGTPTRSSSCGYHRAANDSLERDMGEFVIGVSPYYKKGKELSVVVWLQYDEGNFELIKEEILVIVNGENIYSPAKVTINQYAKDNTHLNRIFINLVYPILSETISNLEVRLPNIAMNTIDSFRFDKITKTDIYYASINC